MHRFKTLNERLEELWLCCIRRLQLSRREQILEAKIVFGRMIRRDWVHIFATLAIGASFLASVVALFTVLPEVGREAGESARPDGDKMVLTLKGGAEARVSRPNVRPLREGGWY